VAVPFTLSDAGKSYGTFKGFKILSYDHQKHEQTAEYSNCQWSAWSECPVSCGGGVTRREWKLDRSVFEEQPCNEQVCPSGVCLEAHDIWMTHNSLLAVLPQMAKSYNLEFTWIRNPREQDPELFDSQTRNSAQQFFMESYRGNTFYVKDMSFTSLGYDPPQNSKMRAVWFPNEYIVDYSAPYEYTFNLTRRVGFVQGNLYQNGTLIQSQRSTTHEKAFKDDGLPDEKVHIYATKVFQVNGYSLFGRRFDKRESYGLLKHIKLTELSDKFYCGFGAEWSSWSTCSATCGGGTMEKSRGEEVKTIPCNEQACPEWSQWSDYGACSTTCGEGVEKRYRSKSDVDAPEEDSRPCRQGPCPMWTVWSPWSTCTVSCGTLGTQTRSRSKADSEDETEQERCNVQDCPMWSEWSAWGDCSRSCGGGYRTRSKTKDDTDDKISDFEECSTEECVEIVCPELNMKNYDECTLANMYDATGYKSCMKPYLDALKPNKPKKEKNKENKKKKNKERRSIDEPRRMGKKNEPKCYQNCMEFIGDKKLKKCVRKNTKKIKKNVALQE